MKCGRCGINSATIHFAKMVNNKTTEYHLCDGCAKEMQIKGPANDFHLDNLIAGLQDTPVKDKDIPPEDLGALTGKPGRVDAVCPSCGLTLSMFKRTGRLGCMNCYDAFRDELMPLLRKIHGSAHHTGKTPLRLGAGAGQSKVRSDIKKLRKRLREAISVEEYEEAAKIRDQIREIEKSLKTGETAEGASS